MSAPSAVGTGAADADPRRWRTLALVSGAMLLSLSAWMTATAVGPELQARWGLTDGQVGLLTTTVQLGFVAGTALGALLNLADVLRSRTYFAASAVLAAAANALLLVVPGYQSALVVRFLTGAFLAGVYPPGMKMVSTWFRSARGFAIGTVVGALTVGKAMPYLLKAIGGAASWAVIGGASIGGLLAGALVFAAYRDGPYTFPSRPFEWSRVGRILTHRETMLATGGYLGHMWELYAMWTWAPVFLAVAAAGAVDSAVVDLVAFGAIAAGGLGCVWGGAAADRVGRHGVVNLAMAVSGACCLLAGFALGAPFYLVALLTWVWGFFVVADSAQFSAMITEVAPPDSVGTALMLQTSMGFLLTMVTIQAVPVMVDAVQWRWAFAFLALGPAAGIWSIRRLRAVQGIHSTARAA
ncbi:MAG TPA: MFS transporter [Longimicrobiales bacterium]|nr:MFS transporter [Longimicrobiales bacterium]